jgi:hypothetical protein
LSQQPAAEKGKSGERNDQSERAPGEKVASRKPKSAGTEKVAAKKIQGAWGDLPDYILKHGRGSMPTVPEKYRKYLEALTKEAHKSKGK